MAEIWFALLAGALSTVGSVIGNIIAAKVRSVRHEMRIKRLEEEMRGGEHSVRPRLHRHANILMKHGYRLRTVESRLRIDYNDDDDEDPG